MTVCYTILFTPDSQEAFEVVNHRRSTRPAMQPSFQHSVMEQYGKTDSQNVDLQVHISRFVTYITDFSVIPRNSGAWGGGVAALAPVHHAVATSAVAANRAATSPTQLSVGVFGNLTKLTVSFFFLNPRAKVLSLFNKTFFFTFCYRSDCYNLICIG